jgi:predicted dehydrogenase
MRGLIIGCGSAGRRHLRNLRELRDLDLIAYRHAPGDSEALKREFGVQTYLDLDEALALHPAFAIVANPPHYHVPAALAAARAGCHLLIEKPLSDSLEGVQDLITTVRERNVVALVGFTLRFHPGLRVVKSLLEEERVGRVVSIRAEVGQYLPDWHPGEDYRESYSAKRDLGGGVILDLIHELDYVRWLVGEVREVGCMAGHESRLEIETEDVAEILLRFESGAIGNVHMDYVQRDPSRTCRIVGEEGTIVWDYFANEVRLFEATSQSWRVFPQDRFDRNDLFLSEMKHFLACVDGRETPLVDLEEARQVQVLALAAQESACSGKVCSV